MEFEYYYLKKGDIIREGDEVDLCNNSFKDEPDWHITGCVGQKAPDPTCPAHRIYRRKILKHEESENCWCSPAIEEYENGNKLIIHNDEN